MTAKVDTRISRVFNHKKFWDKTQTKNGMKTPMTDFFEDVNVVAIDGLREKVASKKASLAYVRMAVDDRETYDAAWHVRVTEKDKVFLLITTRHIRAKTFSTLEQLYKFHVEIFGDAGVPITVPVQDNEFSPEHKLPRNYVAK